MDNNLASQVSALQEEINRLKQQLPSPDLLDTLEAGLDKLAAATSNNHREQLDAFATALPDVVFILDEEGRYTEVLSNHDHLLYQEATQLEGHLMQDVLPPDVASAALVTIQHTLETQQSQVLEYQLNVPAGTLWFEGRTAPMPSAVDGKRQVVWVARDITDRKAAEMSLHERETQMSVILDNMPIILYTLSPDSTITFATGKGLALLGLQSKDVIGKSVFDLFTKPDDYDDIISQVLEGATILVHTELRGEWYDNWLTPLRDNRGQVVSILGIAANTTERKRAQDRFSRTFHASPAGTLIARADDGEVLEVNQSFLDLTDYTRDEIIGKTCNELAVWQHPNECLTGDEYQRNRESEICTKANEPRTVLISSVPIHFDGVACVLTQIHDITEKKLSQLQMMQLEMEHQHSAYLHEFINNISHHFSNPLSVINTTLYLLETKLGEQPTAKYVEMLQRQATILSVLVSKLTAMSHLDDRSQFMFVRVRINLLMYRMAARRWKHVQEHGLELELDVQQEVPLIRADPNLLENALGEIVDNAVYHTAPGGTITSQLYTQGKFIIIKISDTGEGIAPQDLPHVFDRFYRADAARTDVTRAGLGLSIAKTIIEAHRGQITVDSTPGSGAIFTISLPIEPML